MKIMQIDNLNDFKQTCKNNDCLVCLHQQAHIRYKDGDIGIDLSNRYDTNVTAIGMYQPPTFTILTGVKLYMPNGICAKLYARSSTYLKTGLILSNSTGIIDPSYRGEIKAIMIALDITKLFSQDYVTVKLPKHTRLLQLVFAPVTQLVGDIYILRDQTIWDNFHEHFESYRGENGFGHTGM